MNKELLKNSKDRLEYFNWLYNDAVSNCRENFSLMQKQYQGDNSVDGGGKNTHIVRNITYELIESQISSIIPTPNVVPKNLTYKTEENAKAITDLLKNLRDELPFEKINDEDERNTYVYGTSLYFAQWNFEKNNVDVSLVPIEQFVPEPKVYEIEDMNYFFLNFYETPYNIKEKYNVEIEEKYLDANGLAKVIVCFFKENGVVSQMVFTSEMEILYVENYYSRKKLRCKNCGEYKENCSCESNEFELVPVLKEKISDNIVEGNVVIPKKSPIIINGVMQKERVFDEGTGKFLLVPRQKDTVIPIYSPSVYPVAVRKNISKSYSFYGQSDVMAIRGQQQEINKLESRIMEKLVNAGVLPYSSETTDLRLSDEIYTRGIKLKNPQEKNLLGVIDIQANIAQDVMQSDRLYNQAKRILGISDSFQGMPDSSATSGVAKQMLIMQSGGRLESKRVMKNAAYADLDKIIFQFFLAFSSASRKVVSLDSNGEKVGKNFSRYDFLEMNQNGDYVFNDEYLFSTDVVSDIERNKNIMWGEIRNNFAQGAYGDISNVATKILFWKNMLRARYPYAKENIEVLEEQAKIIKGEIEN